MITFRLVDGDTVTKGTMRVFEHSSTVAFGFWYHKVGIQVTVELACSQRVISDVIHRKSLSSKLPLFVSIFVGHPFFIATFIGVHLLRSSRGHLSNGMWRSTTWTLKWRANRCDINRLSSSQGLCTYPPLLGQKNCSSVMESSSYPRGFIAFPGHSVTRGLWPLQQPFREGDESSVFLVKLEEVFVSLK